MCAMLIRAIRIWLPLALSLQLAIPQSGESSDSARFVGFGPRAEQVPPDMIVDDNLVAANFNESIQTAGSVRIVTGEASVAGYAIPRIVQRPNVVALECPTREFSNKWLLWLVRSKTSIKRLSLSGSGVSTLQGLREDHLSMLQELAVSDTAVGDDSAAIIAKLPLLKFANVSYTRMTDTGFAKLGESRSLVALSADRIQVTGKSFREWRFPERLEALSIRSSLSPEGIRDLMRFKRLKYLRAGEVVGDLAMRDVISAMPDLIGLNLNAYRYDEDDDSIDDTWLPCIGQNKKIRYLYLSGSHITSAGLSDLGVLSELADLDIRGCRVEDDGLERLSPFTKLRRLLLGPGQGRRNLGDAGMEFVGRLKLIEELDLTGTNVTAIGVQKLIPLSNLRILNLSGTKIRKDSIELFPRMRALERLDVSSTPLAAAALNELRKACPQLQIFPSLTNE